MNDLAKMFIGFDRVFDQMFTNMNKTSYPPYNVIKVGDNTYTLSMAVAGFSTEDLTISVKKNTLTVAANKQEKDDCDYTWRGIANRSFKRGFCLAYNFKGIENENTFCYFIVSSYCIGFNYSVC